MTELREQAISVANRHIIERPRLTRLLDETTARVIMLVAPAGYGKTTVARQWMRERTHGWLQGAAAYADVAALAAGISRSLTSVLGQENRAIANWLKVTSNPVDSLEALASLQREDLARWPDGAWLVLDEYEWLAASPACEEYVRLLVDESAMRLLITSRQKPLWATARRCVYGDVAVVDRRLLRMSDEEARSVLSQSGGAKSVGAASREFIRAASGWPAVLGLAVTQSPADISNVVPAMLYEYLAEELFYRSSADLRAALPLLALAPEVSLEVTRIVAGSASSRLLEEAGAAGYLTDPVECSAFHPLLKDFLLTKTGRGDPEATRVARDLVDLYVAEERWDSAFHVLQNHPDDEALGDLIKRGREPLLRQGRTATLTEWVAKADRERVGSPRIELLKAELAARAGRVIHAERMAMSIAHSDVHSLRFEALCLAGRAAHLSNREAAALEHFREAEGLASTDEARQEARFGALVCATALRDKHELARSLEEFLEYVPRSADGVTRAANARLYASAILGGLDSALEDGLGIVDLAQECDPLVSTSFLNALSRLLSLVGLYDQALGVAERALEVGDSAGLSFVRPHGLLARGVALMGLGAYGDARDALVEAEKVATAIRDRHNMVDAVVVRAKLSLCRGDAVDALELTEEIPRGVTSGLAEELIATRALSFACAGKPDRATELIRTLPDLSFLPDAAALVLATEAVVAAHENDGPTLLARLGRITEVRTVDALVVAQRGSRELVAKLASADIGPELHALLRTRANPGVRFRGPLDTLTPRQNEVLSLLRLGLTNREIASRLVIEEGTAKVHVRQVLKKLGVRSRTEAAVLATRLAREDPDTGTFDQTSDS
jgi:ATP/maltotriose-dependent transcriptional regulator MalT